MKKIEICKLIKQPQGFKACIPALFPPAELFNIPQNIINKAANAERLIGKLDGVTQTSLPDIEFFLKMFAFKDATASSQIEGTRATMTDALEASVDIGIEGGDADDIIFYIKALDYGIKRLKRLPLSLRFIRELHRELIQGARATQFSDPGEFRRSQNYIGGTRPGNADFVPPPAEEMKKALDDFEKFLYDNKSTLPILHIGYSHAQFETIHPFLDGNGRTGRLLITFLLIKKGLLENPVLFISSFFRKHQKTYYNKLSAYHSGRVFEWLDFFLEGVIETAQDSIEVSSKIRQIYDEDMVKIQALAKRESESSVKLLFHLFKNPIITSSTVVKALGFSRPGARKVIERFIKLNILEKHSQEKKYGQQYIYRRYFDAFID